ncbi:hypothetical protein [Metabacillus litoralis]|uniref:hypothetical protein n=1 Tax=Metabacillus litoralis TaxID=152268 RepID=UPI0020423A94|nr:hypothetical protein [Metabacillus litoralis]MCM3160998.1 hypothetical protein [Metabacillus litoralis]
MSVKGNYSSVISNEEYITTTDYETTITFDKTLNRLVFRAHDSGMVTHEDGRDNPKNEFQLKVNNSDKLLMSGSHMGYDNKIELDNVAISSITIYGKGVVYYYYGVSR